MLGEIICKLRKELDYSQEYLGKLLNVSASSIGMYEQNRRIPNIETLISMNEIFSVSCDYLLEITYDRTQYEKPQHSNESSISKRILFLMKEQDLDITFVSSVTKIQRQRLENILNEKNPPSIADVISLAECFGTTSDYILCLTDYKGISGSKINKTGNSFPNILALLLDPYTELEVANSIDISIAKLRSLLSGSEDPDPNTLSKLASFFGKSTDFLLGLTDKSREPDTNGSFPFTVNEVSLKRIQDWLGDYYEDYLSCELGLQDDEMYMLYHFGFIPHIDVLNKLCKMSSLSADYILGLSDSKLTIISEKNNDEDILLKSYRKLDENYKKKVDGFIAEQIIQQERDSYMRLSVAADELPQTGSDPK